MSFFFSKLFNLFQSKIEKNGCEILIAKVRLRFILVQKSHSAIALRFY